MKNILMLLGYTSGRNSSPKNSGDNLVPRPPLGRGLGTRLFGRCARVDMWSGHVIDVNVGFVPS